MSTDIHHPLGKNRPPAGKRGPRGHGKAIAISLAVLLVFGGGAFVAWQSQIPAPTQQPTDVAVAQIEADDTRETDDIEIFDGDKASGSPPGSGMQSQSGHSGANITTSLDENGGTITKFTPATRDQPGAVLLSPPDRVGQDPRLAHLPDPAVTEETPDGELPVIGASGERAFDIYAKPWSGARGTRIAILVGGLGLSQTGTQYALQKLPTEVTVAFAANGNSLQRWMQEARRDGREIMLQVPFEPFDYPRNDPGRGTLTVEAGAEKNIADLHAAMGEITNYTGITNFMGGRFLADPDALEPVMRDIAKRGIMFLDDGSSAQSLTDQYSRAFGIPFAASDIILDGTQERGYILGKLDDLERIARRNGKAIGVASAFEVSVDAIAAWANEAKARGIEFVGVAAVADDPER
ncbi:divergent polysaccharide deacetylase family protein [Pseudohoeflea suaedae]|uniref:Divergent polysaccharide deacetylase family protein n=1 Tax=Pseudohoeflea suaedae TaxID=877384 RepID=A0A4R5PLG2_9HYPH|nr:divergent polysaccharide deacetylase family protein [Pseudohoeflea suaedae]TDH37658.1 divergent polysaccharide deacetylase family protein [Pseudohoeflea suaedae]